MTDRKILGGLTELSEIQERAVRADVLAELVRELRNERDELRQEVDKLREQLADKREEAAACEAVLHDWQRRRLEKRST